MLLQIIHFFLIKSEAAQYSRSRQFLLRIHAIADPAHHVLAPQVVNMRQIEFANVAPVQLISGLRELLGAGVYVQTVGKIVANRSHVSAYPSRCLENGYVVTAACQFISAAHSCDAAARNHHRLWVPALSRRCIQSQTGASRALQHLPASEHVNTPCSDKVYNTGVCSIKSLLFGRRSRLRTRKVSE